MLNFLLILLGKLVLFISQTFNLGSGSTWPGHISLELNSNFIREIFEQNSKLKVVLVAGTNGKTTTSLMLMKILEEGGLKVFRNEAGANLLNGIASTLISNSNLFGKLNFDAAIFEVDENNLGEAIGQVASRKSPVEIVLLNLFRDQLDRYGEVNTVAKSWDRALSKLPHSAVIFTNGDDPKLADIAGDSTLVRYYFGIEEKLMDKGKPGYDVDFTYCPNCQTKLEYSKVSYSHLGKFVCPNCRYTNHDTETFPTLPHALFGKYNVYNTNAAALVAQKAFDIPIAKIESALKDFKPAFGRQEIIKYKGRNVLILLSKNPAGFNQSIDALADRLHPRGGNMPTPRGCTIVLVLNDRIPDGRDVSWIWDVDFENLPKDSKIFISGDRVYDMALRIKYSQLSVVSCQLFEDLSKAIETAISQTKPNETLFILPTYSAMLEVRMTLLGRKLL